jgi:hypothetical protein
MELVWLTGALTGKVGKGQDFELMLRTRFNFEIVALGFTILFAQAPDNLISQPADALCIACVNFSERSFYFAKPLMRPASWDVHIYYYHILFGTYEGEESERLPLDYFRRIEAFLIEKDRRGISHRILLC